MTLRRLTKAELDHGILDITAALIARHGARATSAQAVADATGYSKAAIFARFDSKERLISRTMEECAGVVRNVAASVTEMPPGADRDRAALQHLTRAGFSNGGFIALALASVTLDDDDLNLALLPMRESLYGMFATPAAPDKTAPRRWFAVTGALAALAVLLLTYETVADQDVAYELIVSATCGVVNELR